MITKIIIQIMHKNRINLILILGNKTKKKHPILRVLLILFSVAVIFYLGVIGMVWVDRYKALLQLFV